MTGLDKSEIEIGAGTGIDKALPGELLPSATPTDRARAEHDLKDHTQRLNHRKYTFFFLIICCGAFLLNIVVWPIVIYCRYEFFEPTTQSVTIFGVWLAAFAAIALSLMLALVKLVEAPTKGESVESQPITTALLEAGRAIVNVAKKLTGKG